MEWVPITEAARLLGVSPRTIERRIARRKIEAKKEEWRGQTRWLVQVEETAPTDAPSTTRQDFAAFVDLLREKDQEIRGLHKDMGDLIARHGVALERLRLLEASRVRRPSLAERVKRALWGQP